MPSKHLYGGRVFEIKNELHTDLSVSCMLPVFCIHHKRHIDLCDLSLKVFDSQV